MTVLVVGFQPGAGRFASTVSSAKFHLIAGSPAGEELHPPKPPRVRIMDRLMLSGLWKMPTAHGSRNIGLIMRTLLQIPSHLVREAALYSPHRDQLDAVCHVLEDYPRLVSQLRKTRAELRDLKTEVDSYDDRLNALQAACRAILDL